MDDKQYTELHLEGGRERGREGGRKGGREGGREGERERVMSCYNYSHFHQILICTLLTVVNHWIRVHALQYVEYKHWSLGTCMYSVYRHWSLGTCM